VEDIINLHFNWAFIWNHDKARTTILGIPLLITVKIRHSASSGSLIELQRGGSPVASRGARGPGPHAIVCPPALIYKKYGGPCESTGPPLNEPTIRGYLSSSLALKQLYWCYPPPPPLRKKNVKNYSFSMPIPPSGGNRH